MKILHHPERDSIQLAAVLYALSDPIRLSVVSEIACSGERPCSHFAFPVAKSTASHHIRTLREAGIVHVRIQGTQHLLSLRREDLESRFPGMLDAILQAAANTKTPPPG